MGKLQQFDSHDFFKAMNFSNSVADFDNRAHLHHRDAGFEIQNLLANDFVYFVCLDWFHKVPSSLPVSTPFHEADFE